MIGLLVDHNMKGQGLLIWKGLVADGWQELLQIQLFTFADIILPVESNDREVWRFAQANNMILLTANRQMKEEDSLEQTLRDENNLSSLPIITIGNVRRIPDRSYRELCVTRIAEIIFDLDIHLGRGRIFIP